MFRDEHFSHFSINFHPLITRSRSPSIFDSMGIRENRESLTLFARSSMLPVPPAAASTSFCRVWGSGERSRAPLSNSQRSCRPDMVPEHKRDNRIIRNLPSMNPLKSESDSVNQSSNSIQPDNERSIETKIGWLVARR